jgi:hypothetical protein
MLSVAKVFFSGLEMAGLESFLSSSVHHSTESLGLELKTPLHIHFE